MGRRPSGKGPSGDRGEGERRPTVAELAARFAAGDVDDSEILALRDDPRAGVVALVERWRGRRARAAREAERLSVLSAFERDLWTRGVARIAGIDEVGAGTLAGPLVAGAVILAPGSAIEGVDDSKKLSRAAREAAAERIRAEAVAFAFGCCSAAEVDALNVLRASEEAMRRAVLALGCVPEHLLVDARHVPGVGVPQTAIVGGDARSQSIAAASVLAKVERDRMMEALALEHPGYGFERHRGYGTAEHLAALARLGPSAVHRNSFAPVRAARRGLSPVRPRQLALL